MVIQERDNAGQHVRVGVALRELERAVADNRIAFRYGLDHRHPGERVLRRGLRGGRGQILAIDRACQSFGELFDRRLALGHFATCHGRDQKRRTGVNDRCVVGGDVADGLRLRAVAAGAFQHRGDATAAGRAKEVAGGRAVWEQAGQGGGCLEGEARRRVAGGADSRVGQMVGQQECGAGGVGPVHHVEGARGDL